PRVPQPSQSRGSGSGGMELSTAPASWSLPAPVSGAAVASVPGVMYVLGGLGPAGASATGVFRIDPASGSVTPAGDLTAPTHDAAAAYLGGRVLLFGGGDQSVSATVEGFAPGAAPSIIGSLPSPRADLAAVVAGDRAYLVGGYDGTNLSPTVLSTRDGASFQPVATLPVPVRYPAVAAVGGSLYVFGGQTAAGDTAAIQRVNLASGSARVVGQLPAAVGHAVAATLGGRVYILGGDANGQPSDQVSAYRPGDGAAVSAGVLPQPVANASLGIQSNTAYVIGGLGPGGVASSSVSMVRLIARAAKPAQASASGAGQPFSGRLLIADRGNNRLLLVDAAKHVLWTYPSPSA